MSHVCVSYLAMPAMLRVVSGLVLGLVALVIKLAVTEAKEEARDIDEAGKKK